MYKRQVLDGLTVTDTKGNELKLTARGDGKYAFTMPGRKVTVKAVFVPAHEGEDKPCGGGIDCPSRAFTDINVEAWYHESVDYAIRAGLMGGYGDGRFGPDDNLIRAELTQILYNYAERPDVTGESAFSDVQGGAWYADAITWAAANGIVNGYGDDLFGPEDNITREQLAVILWRYAGSPEAGDNKLDFADAGEVSQWALEAVKWANANGIINGHADGRLDPGGSATRAQAAQMIKNFFENVKLD